MPPRLLQFHLRLNWFNFGINHTPGKELDLADALSWAPVFPPGSNNMEFVQEVKSFVQAIVTALPAKVKRLPQYQNAQRMDRVSSKLLAYCKRWPGKHHLPSEMKLYWKYQVELTIVDDLLLCDYTSCTTSPDCRQATPGKPEMPS